MKVVCVQLVSPVDGKPLADSAWVMLDTEYPVLSILLRPVKRCNCRS